MKNFIKTMGRGLVRTLGGAAIFSAAAFSIYGYTMVPEKEGYLAVAHFALNTATLACSLIMMYISGIGAKHGKHQKEER